MNISRNGPTLWDNLLEIVGTHYSPVVAGGAIRDFYLGVEPKDVDIFVPAEFDEDLVSITDALPAHLAHGSIIWLNEEASTGMLDLERLAEAYTAQQEYSGAGFAPDLIGVWEGSIMSIPVNIIGRRSLEDGAGPLVDTFDFDVLRGWHTTQGYTLQRPAMVRDLDDKTMTLATSQTYQQSLRRYARFNARHPGLLRLRDPFSREFH